MRPEQAVGLSLREVAHLPIFRHKGIRVFILCGKSDKTGRPIIQEYTMQRILLFKPWLGDYVVEFAEDYYGQLLLRVRFFNE